ncbi:MAG: hypothetical protein QOF59_1156 [Actinomycetota bacterium]|nr:hypothetical protein [Actinomycetota bacterium]
MVSAHRAARMRHGRSTRTATHPSRGNRTDPGTRRARRDQPGYSLRSAMNARLRQAARSTIQGAQRRGIPTKCVTNTKSAARAGTGGASSSMRATSSSSSSSAWRVVPTRSSSPRSAATSSPDQQTRCHPIHKVRSVRSMNWVRYASPSLAHRRRPGSGSTRACPRARRHGGHSDDALTFWRRTPPTR